MSLTAGTRLGPYEIVAAIGAGGMGEVYRARDTRLGRDVAVKILPAHVAADPERKPRFEREARAISGLNHPHICTLHDVGRENGTDFLVMEYLEGETLAKRLTRGAVPLEQALRYAIQIADALDKAHRSGVVHRDLKPANVMLTRSGAKLLDFGLAKASAADTAVLPGATVTHSTPLTQQGTIVGTLQYMAPEQLEGKDADTRSDIFAFGAVLYEMVTGRKAFEGKSQASVIAAILERDPPPVSGLEPMTPPALERIVRTCLAKDRDERVQSAHDVLLELKWLAEANSQAGVAAPVAARRQRRERGLPLAVAVLSLVSAAAIAALIWKRWSAQPLAEPGVIRFSVSAPAGHAIAARPEFMHVALSPDGRSLAFVATDESGDPFLWVRPLDSNESRRLDHTRGAIGPFWSPDSRSIAFFMDGKLKRIPAAGGLPQTLCDAPGGRGGTWGRRGEILFATAADGPLLRVGEGGGSAEAATELDDGHVAHVAPEFLPDGDRYLFMALTTDPNKRGIYLRSTASGQTRFLARTAFRGGYAPDCLLVVRDNALVAFPFDSERGETTGPPAPAVQDIRLTPLSSIVPFSVSASGLLAYISGNVSERRQFVWVDRSGRRLGTVGEIGNYFQFTLSPDEKRVAVVRRGPEGLDVWLLQLTSGIMSRLTFDAGPEADAVWSPDSRRIVYAINKKGWRLLELTIGSRNPIELPRAGERMHFPDDWSRDGRLVIFHDQQSAFVQPMTGERKPRLAWESSFKTDEYHFSPDGRWVAFVSYESGRADVYAATFPDFADRRQISSNGGGQPLWHQDGKELFYLSSDGKLMAVDIKASANSLEASAPRMLFATRIDVNPGHDQYAVAQKGERFLLMEPVGEAAQQIQMIANWKPCGTQ